MSMQTPDDMTPAARVSTARQRATTAIARIVGDAPVGDDTAWPLPPPELIGTINSPEKCDPQVFLASGLDDLAHVLVALDESGRRLPARPDVLDFGCGAGRILRHLRPWAGRVGAVDRHGEALAWIETHLPDVDTERTPGEPPLQRWAAASFDLIVANSVFTHIPLRRQDAWGRELARLLRPTGVALVTVLGAEHRARLLDGPARAALARDGAFESGPERDPATGEVAAYAAVFQTPDACLEAFGRAFDVRHRRSAPGHQDVLVLSPRTGHPGA